MLQLAELSCLFSNWLSANAPPECSISLLLSPHKVIGTLATSYKSMSDLQDVWSRVPQRSVLKLVLFSVLTNHLDARIESFLRECANDPKLGRTANTLEDTSTIQQDLDRLERWPTTNKMKFGANKCKLMHLEKNYQNHKYKMDGNRLDGNNAGEDLGVSVDHRLNINLQCKAAAKRKASVVLGCINVSVKYYYIYNDG